MLRHCCGVGGQILPILCTQEQLGLRGIFEVTLVQLPREAFNGRSGVGVSIRVYLEKSCRLDGQILRILYSSARATGPTGIIWVSSHQKVWKGWPAWSEFTNQWKRKGKWDLPRWWTKDK
jgi:hypothetical protein